MSHTLKMLGSFENSTQDAVFEILKHFECQSLINMATTNSPWRRVISKFARSSDYLKNWTQTMSRPEAVAANCVETAKLIEKAHESRLEGVGLLEKFMKKTSHEVAGNILSALFEEEKEGEEVKEIASKVFELGWNLEKDHFPHEISEIIDFLGKRQRFVYAWASEEDTKNLEQLAERTLRLKKSLNSLFRFESFEAMKASVERELFNKMKQILDGDVSKLRLFITFLLSPLDRVTGKDVNMEYFKREEKRNENSLRKMEPVAKFFKRLLKTSETPEDEEFLTKVFVKFINIPAPLISCALHREPSLLQLLLNDHDYSLEQSEFLSEVILRTLISLSHYNAGEEQYADLRKTLERFRRRCLMSEDGRRHLKKLSDGVLEAVNNHPVIRNHQETQDNRFWNVFHDILRK